MQSQGRGDAREQPVRPVLRLRGTSATIADTEKLRSIDTIAPTGPNRAGARAPAPALCAADDFDAIRYNIFRIGVRKA